MVSTSIWIKQSLITALEDPFTLELCYSPSCFIELKALPIHGPDPGCSLGLECSSSRHPHITPLPPSRLCSNAGWPHRSYFPVHLLWVSSSYPNTHSPNPCPTSSSSLQLPSHIQHISCFHLSFVLPFAPNLGMQVVWWQEFLSVWLLLYL